MPTIAECLTRAESLTAISDSARLDTEILLAHALNQSRTYLYTWPEKVLTDTQQAAFEACFARRQQGEPVAHITGEREFWSLTLKVNNSTLIPRPETELLVEKALALLPETPQRVVDLGTGTGAIALALASERPGWQILALDKYPEAVALAEDNRQLCGLDNVRVLQSDWFSALPEQFFDLVVSNPPYVDPVDPHLQQGDVRFEPLTALVAEDKGLADIAIIADQALPRLECGGWLMLEHGFDQGQPVCDILSQRGFAHVRTYTDLAGMARVSVGQKPA